MYEETRAGDENAQRKRVEANAADVRVSKCEHYHTPMHYTH